MLLFVACSSIPDGKNNYNLKVVLPNTPRTLAVYQWKLK